jgi:hypothetical protein
MASLLFLSISKTSLNMVPMIILPLDSCMLLTTLMSRPEQNLEEKADKIFVFAKQKDIRQLPTWSSRDRDLSLLGKRAIPHKKLAIFASTNELCVTSACLVKLGSLNGIHRALRKQCQN